MARGVNKAILVGNVGQDPEPRYTANGDLVIRITLATSDQWKDKQTGQTKQHTEWHNVIFYRRLAEVVKQYVHRGQQLYIEGRIRTRKWQDKEGRDRWTTEIIAEEMKMLGGRNGQGGQDQRLPQAPEPALDGYPHDRPVDDGFPEHEPGLGFGDESPGNDYPL